MIRSVPTARRYGRIGQGEVTSGAIVSAVDADTGEALPDFVSSNSGPLFVSATTSGADGSLPSTSPTGGVAQSTQAVFTSPNAYASGTGLGPLNLPSIIPASLANLLPNANTILLILVALAAVWLVSENRR